jgi:ribosome-binding protein aMBF1 (putative translation factor)
VDNESKTSHGSRAGGSVSLKDFITFNQNVRNLRNERGWSLEEFTQRADVHLSTLREIETRSYRATYMRTVK